MARRALREPRGVAAALPPIGVQPDMFGGPAIVHDCGPVHGDRPRRLRGANGHHRRLDSSYRSWQADDSY